MITLRAFLRCMAAAPLAIKTRCGGQQRRPFAGSVVSIAIAQNLIITFSGKGLIPDALAASPQFAFAVGLGAALTIFIATYVGMPTSTTHSLIGAAARNWTRGQRAGLVLVRCSINLRFRC